MTQAILKMGETEAAARTLDGSDEVVGDNAYPDIPPKEQTPSPGLTFSSNDQRVPSFHNAEVCRKRPMEEAKDKRTRYDEVGAPDLCSTAESSSSNKKQTTSRYSFSVPHTGGGCSSSTVKPWEESEVELSETNQPPRKEEVETDQVESGKDGTWQKEERTDTVAGGKDDTASLFYE